MSHIVLFLLSTYPALQDVMCAQLNATFGFQHRYSKANVAPLVFHL